MMESIVSLALKYAHTNIQHAHVVYGLVYGLESFKEFLSMWLRTMASQEGQYVFKFTLVTRY